MDVEHMAEFLLPSLLPTPNMSTTFQFFFGVPQMSSEGQTGGCSFRPTFGLMGVDLIPSGLQASVGLPSGLSWEDVSWEAEDRPSPIRKVHELKAPCQCGIWGLQASGVGHHVTDWYQNYTCINHDLKNTTYLKACTYNWKTTLQTHMSTINSTKLSPLNISTFHLKLHLSNFINLSLTQSIHTHTLTNTLRSMV